MNTRGHKKWVIATMVVLSIVTFGIVILRTMFASDKPMQIENTTLKGAAWPFHSVAFSQDSKFVAACHVNGSIRVWDARGGAEWLTIPGAAAVVDISEISFSSKGEAIGWAIGREISLLDVKNKKIVEKFVSPGKDLRNIAFSPKGNILAGLTEDGVVYFWDTETKKARKVFEDKEEMRLESLAFDPEGKTLALGRYGTVNFMNVDNGVIKAQSAKGAQRWVSHLVFSSDGKKIAGITSRNATIWDFPAGTEIIAFAFPNALGSTVAVAFSPGGDRLAIAIASVQNNSGRLKIWDIKAKREVADVDCGQGPITGVAWSGDDTLIATCSRDQTVKLWDVIKIVKK